LFEIVDVAFKGARSAHPNADFFFRGGS
jgi:hypothetical protein